MSSKSRVGKRDSDTMQGRSWAKTASLELGKNRFLGAEWGSEGVNICKCHSLPVEETSVSFFIFSSLSFHFSFLFNASFVSGQALKWAVWLIEGTYQRRRFALLEVSGFLQQPGSGLKLNEDIFSMYFYVASINWQWARDIAPCVKLHLFTHRIQDTILTLFLI
jgi:hypothetical protein